MRVCRREGSVHLQDEVRGARRGLRWRWGLGLPQGPRLTFPLLGPGFPPECLC